MQSALQVSNIPNLLIEKLIREASDNFSYFKDFEKALCQVDQILEMDHLNLRALILKGDILFCMDRDEEALLYFEKAISACPQSPEAYGSKAGTLDVLGRYEEALQFCDKAFSLLRGKDKFLLPSLFDQKLCLLIRLKRFQQAKTILQSAKTILNQDDYIYLSACYSDMIETQYKIRTLKLEKAKKLSMKIVF